MSTEAIYAKYWSALMDVEAVMVPADTVIALALRLAVADAYREGMETCGGMHDDLAAIVARQQQALQNALDQIDPLREERNALLLQLAQLDADNGDLTQRLSNLAGVQAESERRRQEIADLREQVIPDYQNSLASMSAEIDRLTQQNVIAVATFNTLTEVHSNGASAGSATVVDPTTTPEWNRNHPAWRDFSEEQWVTLYRLHSGDLRFRNLSKEDRIDLVGRVLRHLAGGGEPVTAPQFDRQKPAWMPTAGAVVLLAESRKWQDLLNLAAAPA